MRTHIQTHARKDENAPSPLAHTRSSIFLRGSCSATRYNAFSLPLSLGLRSPKLPRLCSWPSIPIAAACWPSSLPLLLGSSPFQTPCTLTISFCSRWRSRSQLRASSTEVGREALSRTRLASTGKKLRKAFSQQRCVTTVELWRSRISKLIDQCPARSPFSNALVPSRNRYKIEHPEATP